jgi:hypothetical protein
MRDLDECCEALIEVRQHPLTIHVTPCTTTHWQAIHGTTCTKIYLSSTMYLHVLNLAWYPYRYILICISQICTWNWLHQWQVSINHGSTCNEISHSVYFKPWSYMYPPIIPYMEWVINLPRLFVSVSKVY